jgi:hypothetical protein
MATSPTSNYNKKFFAPVEKPEQSKDDCSSLFEKLDKKTLLAEETLKNKITAFSFCEELDMIIFGL